MPIENTGRQRKQHLSGMAYHDLHSAQPSHQTSQLNQSAYTLKYAHVCPADFLDRRLANGRYAAVGTRYLDKLELGILRYPSRAMVRGK